MGSGEGFGVEVVEVGIWGLWVEVVWDAEAAAVGAEVVVEVVEVESDPH